MAKKSKKTLSAPANPREHVERLIEWMSQGVYEKEQIIAMALLCAVAGENMFLLGPPGTAKSMVASRLKRVFKDGRAFDYLMSRFSTPDEIFGPISISRLKNDDRYERLTAGYLPEADVVFLDEIWKAGPSIQNTLLTVINEHIFHNGGHTVRTPMKVLIAASNELPAKDEGLEALWDRFLVRMVSNCIESDTAFFKMMKSTTEELPELPEPLYLTDELYASWQSEAKMVDLGEPVVGAIKALRKTLASLEKDDGNNLRYYISDRRWRKAYRLMQTSAFLNGRREIDMTDYLLLIHSFWNDAECIPNILKAFTASISDATIKALNRIDKSLRQIMTSPRRDDQFSATDGSEQNDFAEFHYFYYLVENFPDGETYFSKWDYNSLSEKPRDGVRYYDSKRKKIIIHALMPGRPFDAGSQNASNLQKITIQKCRGGAIINGTPYAFRRRSAATGATAEAIASTSVLDRVTAVQEMYQTCVGQWRKMVESCWTTGSNIFLSQADLGLVGGMIKEVDEQIKTVEVKLNNVVMLMR
ncbi:MAG: AAA domain-containing protein [Bacteroides sp.]|nr:AAA domain-containing protein [Bacteroides sp.]